MDQELAEPMGNMHMMKQAVKFILLFAILLTGCHADLHTKRWAMDHAREGAIVPLIDGFVEISYTENSGMVFGLFNRIDSTVKQALLMGSTWIAILCMLFIVWRLRRLPFLYHLPLFVILSGAVGNLMDRIRFGQVVDFIHIHWKDVVDWPFLFNVADVLICAGGFLLFFLLIFKGDTLERSLFPKTNRKG